MKENSIYEDLSLIRKRARIAFICFKVVFIFLALYFWKIQVLEHKKYWERSEANRIREISLPPQRGLILDRNGNILAKNRASFNLYYIREVSQDNTDSIRKIAELLELENTVLQNRVDRYSDLPAFKPIVIKEDLTHKEVALVEARKRELPEFFILADPKRSYPNGTCAAHVLGYLQEISLDELRTGDYPERGIGDLVGKTGIEKTYESDLVGKPGAVLEVVDSVGRNIGEISRREPQPGLDVSLTLDLELQKKSEEMLQGKEGAVVILQAKSGGLLTMVSYPNFDPNKFINRFTPEEWIDLTNNPAHPLENRAIRGLYSPGSIFKLLVALGALDSRIISSYTTYFCSGTIDIYGHPFDCWFAPGHGRMNMFHAIKNSCNVFFYQVGKKMGIQEIARYARALGLGTESGIDLSGEKAGLVPDHEWKRRARNLPWYPGETISVAIGQGPLQVTPLQLACMTAAIANRGLRITPHIRMGKAPDSAQPRVEIDRDNFEKVIRGMWMCVNEGGTARAALVAGYDVCGKTGSTQVVSSETAEKLDSSARILKTHSWFSGFAPRNDPQVIISVIVEHGGMGGSAAAPIASQLFRLYRERYDR